MKKCQQERRCQVDLFFRMNEIVLKWYKMYHHDQHWSGLAMQSHSQKTRHGSFAWQRGRGVNPTMYVLANSIPFWMTLTHQSLAGTATVSNRAFFPHCLWNLLLPWSKEFRKAKPRETKGRNRSVLTSWSKRSHQNYLCGFSVLFHPGKNAHLCPPYERVVSRLHASGSDCLGPGDCGLQKECLLRSVGPTNTP